ncbi:hypothetical protein J3Q64DRAFT_1712016 [Phycomyces blakesleeanus]|uniref:Uncharacterized protein n=2 Tax=Phycomyces blakesleeanus TaxID=4837 RepID=A0A167JR12_PHYB8|nr:hypothetical protein PHYBLDRAFT_152337 [Phycomyces blakesleeanus NRRL 1555(-)]OAD66536.1 hypothetical protein PHYBLDRAFT_152337 [Phycomyces blakesleeanus NRRL 1555(-)]|eukprot:XP_018284576.1 hypothetical protein PHYBLDRAFT_152337 [Phycomyces blakesleeanus NRRL 1555(-)]
MPHSPNNPNDPENELDILEGVFENVLNGTLSMLFKGLVPNVQQNELPNEAMIGEVNGGEDFKKLARKSRMNKENGGSETRNDENETYSKDDNKSRELATRDLHPQPEIPSLVGLLQHMLEGHREDRNATIFQGQQQDNIPELNPPSLFQLFFPNVHGSDERDSRQVDFSSIYSRSNDRDELGATRSSDMTEPEPSSNYSYSYSSTRVIHLPDGSEEVQTTTRQNGHTVITKRITHPDGTVDEVREEKKSLKEKIASIPQEGKSLWKSLFG